MATRKTYTILSFLIVKQWHSTLVLLIILPKINLQYSHLIRLFADVIVVSYGEAGTETKERLQRHQIMGRKCVAETRNRNFIVVVIMTRGIWVPQ